MQSDVIKEYLVALSTKIDKKGFGDAIKLIDGLGNKTKGLASFALKGGATYLTLASTLVTANVAISKFIENTARADLETENFARRMFMSKEAAQSMNDALKVMGKDLDDLAYMTPEELARFKELRQLSRDITMPADYDQTMRKVRDMAFQGSRIKLILQEGVRRVAYEIAKRIGIDDVEKKLKGFGDWLQKNLPKWAKYIATVAEWFMRLGKAAGSVGEFIFNVFKKLAEVVPRDLLVAGAAVTGFLGLMAMGPLGMFMAAILALLLILDDFATWQRGGKSLFGEFYDGIDKVFKKLEDNNIVAGFTDAFKDLKEVIDDILGLFDLFDPKADAVGDAGSTLYNVLKGVADVLLTIIRVATALYSIPLGAIKGAKEGWASDGLWGALQGFGEGQNNAFMDFIKTQAEDYENNRGVGSWFAARPLTGGDSDIKTDSDNRQYNISFKIDGSSSPIATANAVVTKLGGIDPRITEGVNR